MYKIVTSIGTDEIMAFRMTFKSWDFAIDFNGRKILKLLKAVRVDPLSAASIPS